MIRGIRSNRVLAMVLGIAMIVGMFGSISGNAQHRHYRGHWHSSHSKLKGALIGGAAGTIGGALLGGGKGALIGAAGGAGTGYLIQRHRNRRHRHYYRRY